MMHRNLNAVLPAAALALVVACAPTPPVAAPQPVGIPDQLPGPLPEQPIAFPEFAEFTLDNGLEVIHVPHHVQPIANLTLYLRVGGADDPAERAGQAMIAADLLRQGTTTRTAEQISEAIEGVGGSLWTNADADFLTVSSTVLVDDLPLAFDLVADVTRRPTFPADEVALVVQRTLSGLRAQLGQPAEIARRRFVQEVYGEGHPYGTSPTPASVQAITREALVELHRRSFRPDAAVLVVAGDVDAATARAMAEQHFGDWQPGAPARPVLPRPMEPGPTRIALVHRPGSVQATIRVGHLGIRADEPDFFPLQVMNRVLGGGFTSRLMQRLRDELGWTYGAGSAFTLPRDVGVFSATTEVRNAVADSAVAEILSQLRDLRDQPMDPDEMASAVSYLVGSFPLTIETAGQIAGQIARARLIGRPIEHITGYRDRIAQVTPQDVTTAARRHVDPDRAVIVVVGEAPELLPRLQAIAPVTLYDVKGAPLDDLAPEPASAQAEPTGPRIDAPRIDAIFAEWANPESPGCGLSVVEAGRPVYSRGYGSANLDYQAPITSQTVFYLASVSKQFTAAAVALAALQGYLSLDDDIRKWFPELPDYGATITVSDLVHHTSGLRDYLTLMSLAGMSYGDSWLDDEIVELIARQQGLNFEPGTEYLYSNSGYFLMSELVGRATGLSLREYTTREMFEPLGMHDTWFHDDATQIVRNRAVAYGRDGHGFRITHLFNFDKVGSGGLYSTLDDLARWDANFYDGRIGGPDFLRTMHTRGVLASGDTLRYAFGLNIGDYRDRPTVEHGGSMMGFRTSMLRFPEDRTTVIVLCNLGNINPGQLAQQVADVVLADRLGPAPEPRGRPAAAPAADEPDTAPKPGSPLEAYAGSYHSPELAVSYQIQADENGLLLTRPRTDHVELVSLGDDTFRVRRGGWSIRFIRGDDEAITSFVLDAGRVRGIRFDRAVDD